MLMLCNRLGPLVLAATALTCISCSSDDGQVPVFPVRGKALHEGEPAEGALVIFHPLSSPGPAPLTPHGRVQADGTFEPTTYESGDGAPSGEYAVTFFWPEPPKSPVDDPDSGPDRLRGRYSDPQASPFRVPIGEGTNELEPFQLQ